jgi:diadenosine tetraphosphate (Ap4A) HIT family hydrolase
MAAKTPAPKQLLVTRLFEVGQDREVPIPGFFIIASRRKIRSVTEFSDEEAAEFMGILRKVRAGMLEVLGIKDVYLFQNEDTAWNFHLWIFPRLKWMERFGRKIESVRPIIDYAKREMARDEVMREIDEYVQKMKTYMEDYR